MRSRVPSMLKGGFIVGAKYGRGLGQLPHAERMELRRHFSLWKVAASAFRLAGKPSIW